MKVVIAPNTFKGTIAAGDVARAIAAGIAAVYPNADLCNMPVSDGGDGSLITFLEIFDGNYRSNVVTGPLGEPVEADWGIINQGNTAFIETALAFGLALVPKHRQNPAITTSRGIGDLITNGLDLGLRDFILAVGGSANNDAGTGMLRALGARFLDRDGLPLGEGGLELSRLSTIVTTDMDPRLKTSRFLVLSDSSVPLTGTTGVSMMYSPGKGASNEMAQMLDRALQHYANIVCETFQVDIATRPAGGAGGGVVSAAELFLNAQKAYGIDVVLEKIDFETSLLGADMVIVAEGQVDEQTIYNKAPIGVAKIAQRHHIPVLAISAKLGKGYESVFDHGIDAVAEVTGPSGWQPDGSIVNEHTITLATQDIFEQIKAHGRPFDQTLTHLLKFSKRRTD